MSSLFTALFGALFRRWRGAFITLVFIAAYPLLVGAGASAVRAALMGRIALFAVQLGRRRDRTSPGLRQRRMSGGAGCRTPKIAIIVFLKSNVDQVWGHKYRPGNNFQETSDSI